MSELATIDSDVRLEEIAEILTPKHRIFAEEYLIDWNGTRAYKVAYPTVKNDNVAAVNANKLLRTPKMQQYIKKAQDDIEKIAGVSRLRVIREHMKIAFSSIAHMHNTWIDRKDFESLTNDQRACISEIETQILKRNIGTSDEPDIVDVEKIKIKLYDKQKSLTELAKLLGHNAEKESVGTQINIQQNNLFQMVDSIYKEK